MNKRVTSLYAVVLKNKVIAYGNLTETLSMLEKAESIECRYPNFYYRKFKKEDCFVWEGYNFQRLI